MDDYFSTLGRYLGRDDARTAIVRVISQDDWNKYWIKHADETESISYQTGEKLSDVYSKAMIWVDDVNLRIYNHYNPTVYLFLMMRIRKLQVCLFEYRMDLCL